MCDLVKGHVVLTLRSLRVVTGTPAQRCPAGGEGPTRRLAFKQHLSNDSCESLIESARLDDATEASIIQARV